MKSTSFQRLLDIMDALREQCPWDREQTFDTLRPLTIEETYELSEAILQKDYNDICKELGDLLLHIVFYAKIGEEQQQFTIDNVIDKLCDKLIFRHPHVFSETAVKNAGEVVQNWEQLKLKEKDGNKTVLSGVPHGLPSLVKAYRIQDKARAVGFDWEEREQVWDKVAEEIGELKAELAHGTASGMEDELGDVLFSIVNAARLYAINPDTALERTNRKFIERFNYLEQQTIKKGRSLKDMTLDEMNEIWEEAKTIAPPLPPKGEKKTRSMMSEGLFDRTKLLIGEEGVARLNAAHVLVVGLGGVGAYAAEMLCRAGIGQLTMVDADIVSATNRNRQLLALASTEGRRKIDVMSERLLDINPALALTVHPLFLDEEAIAAIMHPGAPEFPPFHYVVDAIDTLSPKVALIAHCVQRGIPIVSAMGAGAKTDATKIELADLSKSHHCPLAHQLRKRLHRQGIRKGVKVVYSSEAPNEQAIELVEERNKKSIVGTISYLPAIFGCLCAQAVVMDLIAITGRLK